MTRLLHLNGPPGIGKSTLARRYADDHPGVLVCDIDVLRTLVGGWESRFGETGALIRPAALAMITAYLSGGHDVVLPQLLVRPRSSPASRPRRRTAGADFVERFVMDTEDAAVARFHRARRRPRCARPVARPGPRDRRRGRWRRVLRTYHAGLVRLDRAATGRSS